MVEQMQSFPTSEIQVGHILPTGVVISIWDDKDDDGREVVILLTAAGVGHALGRGDMVTRVLGRVSDEVVETLRVEFAEMYEMMMGEAPEAP
jgi:hypothetical protein